MNKRFAFSSAAGDELSPFLRADDANSGTITGAGFGLEAESSLFDHRSTLGTPSSRYEMGSPLTEQPCAGVAAVDEVSAAFSQSFILFSFNSHLMYFYYSYFVYLCIRPVPYSPAVFVVRTVLTSPLSRPCTLSLPPPLPSTDHNRCWRHLLRPR